VESGEAGTILAELVRIQYGRNDVSFERAPSASAAIRRDLPAYAEQAIRIELWGDEVERISKINPLTGEPSPSSISARSTRPSISCTRAAYDRAGGEADPCRAGRAAASSVGAGQAARGQRLESRTNFDIEMLLEIGTCAGIENYSPPLWPPTGERPPV
jgi:excinuclease ABC subunit B